MINSIECTDNSKLQIQKAVSTSQKGNKTAWNAMRALIQLSDWGAKRVSMFI